jgi:urease accessory protein
MPSVSSPHTQSRHLPTASAPTAGNRSWGQVVLSVKASVRGTVPDRTFQSGCLRLRLPNTMRNEAPCFVLMNTSGGLAEGDQLDQAIRWADDTDAAVTTQAAEKVYRATQFGASIRTRIEAGEGSHAEWLPQETILFDRSRLTRSTEVHLAAGARFLGCEAIVFGRAAMGESLRSGLLDDRWRIWRDGRLIHADALHLEGPVKAMMGRAAIGAGATALAFIVLVSTGAALLLDGVRAALAGIRGRAAASVSGTMLIVRLLACDGATLRHDCAIALAVLRGGRPLPRVWGC